MRELIDSCATTDDFIRAFCVDKPGELGRCSSYEFKDGDRLVQTLQFQTGAPSDGINGVTNESVLLVLLDRMRLWSAAGKTSQRLYDAQRHLGAALMLLRDDFNDPWPDLDGAAK